MSPAPGLRSRDAALGWEEFEQLASLMLVDLASATGVPPDDLRRSAAESLVTLRVAGEFVLPAQRLATISGDESAVRDLIDGPLTQLVEVASRGSLSSGTLWGNVASVIESSARILVAENPESADRATAVAARMLGHPRLRGCWSGEVCATFRRTTCCLVVGPDPDELRCGDCVRGPSPA